MYCYREFKLRYLKNLKLFSIRVKELFEPIVLQKKATAFCSFTCKHFLEKPKLFSIRVKELFEPIVLQKKATAFCSFTCKHFLEKPIFE